MHRLGFATGLRRARKEDIKSAEEWMALHGHVHGHEFTTSSDEPDTLVSSECTTENVDVTDANLDVWDEEALGAYVRAKPGRCVVLVDGYAVDVTSYLGDHVCVRSQSQRSLSFTLLSLARRSSSTT